jgi:hypothetical protein
VTVPANTHSGRTRRDVPWTRLAARLAAAVVAVVAGAASFEHIASVASDAGERAWVSYSLPLAIDGLIVVGVAALLEDQRHHRHGRLSARLAVLVGVVATLAANVASAEPTGTARLVALAAPVSFLLSVEVLTRTGRKMSTLADTVTTGEPAGRRRAVDGDTSTAARPSGRAAPVARRRPNTADRVAHAVMQSPTATPAEIAARLKVSERTVQRYWPDATPAAATEEVGRPSASRPRVAPVPTSAFDRPNGHTAAVPGGRRPRQ